MKLKFGFLSLLLVVLMSLQPAAEPPFIQKIGEVPVGGGFRMPGYWVWCMSVVRGDDGQYHGFASRWSDTLSFRHWVTSSEIVHCTSPTPEGPYTFRDVVLPARGAQFWDGKMTHNPTIHKIGNKYALFYIGTRYGYDAAQIKTLSREQHNEARSQQRIGCALADSPWGPWQRADRPILEPRPGEWDAFMTTNPAVSVRPDGGVLLLYKSAKHETGLLKIGVAGASHPGGPYQRLSEQPVLDYDEKKGDDTWNGKDRKHVEDPYVWWNGRHYEAILKDMNGTLGGEFGAGVHATSPDGIQWSLSENPQAYSCTVRWSDGHIRQMAAFERPQLLFHDGKPTHLFVATGNPKTPNTHWMKGGFAGDTWNMVVKLKP